MSNTKVIYTLKVHIELQKRGFKCLIEMRNPKNQHLNCWVYEATPEFMKVFNELVGGMRNG